MKIKPWEHIAFNFLPLIGYWFFEWSMFSILYLFWFEAVCISFFYVLEKLYSQGEEITGDKVPFIGKFFSSVKLLLIRWGILFFYWIFMLVFVALGMGKLNQQDSLSNLKVIAFQDSSFNLAILAVFLNGIIHFIRDFILTGRYKVMCSKNYHAIFDSKTIVIHIVIVLGTFAFQFLSQYATMDNRLPGLGYVLVFCLIKMIADWFTGSEKMRETNPLAS